MEQVSGRKAHINFGARPYRPRELMVPWSAGQRLPGWMPQVSLAEGLRRCIEEYSKTNAS
jgi:hypothetical protein